MQWSVSFWFEWWSEVIPLTDMEGKYVQHCGWDVGDCLRVRKIDVGICWILYILVLNTYGCWDFKN